MTSQRQIAKEREILHLSIISEESLPIYLTIDINPYLSPVG
jgi:hypothetical protein